MRMTVTSEDLARAAQNGDAQAFASLIARQYDRLFRLCFRLTGSQHEAEDLTQDICAALPAKLASYDGRAKVTTWLYRVAVNASHDLPPDLRDTLALILDDMTHAEAGDILGISEGTVSWRLSEARKHLKSLKEKEEIA